MSLNFQSSAQAQAVIICCCNVRRKSSDLLVFIPIGTMSANQWSTNEALNSTLVLDCSLLDRSSYHAIWSEGDTPPRNPGTLDFLDFSLAGYCGIVQVAGNCIVVAQHYEAAFPRHRHHPGFSEYCSFADFILK